MLARGPVGLIGIGRMGSAMARRLQECGVAVSGFDADPAATARAGTMGIAAAASPAALGPASDLVLLSLPNGSAVRAALDGSNGLLAAGGSRLVVDLSTIGDRETVDIAELVEGAGSRYLTCPVIGGTSNCGRWTLLVGVEVLPEPADQILPLFGTPRLLGSASQAVRIKVLNNVLLALGTAGLAEVVSLARRLGVDVLTLQSVIADSGSVTASPLVVRTLPRALAGDVENGFPLDLLLKDARLGLDIAAANDGTTSILESSIMLLEGWADRLPPAADFTSVFLEAASEPAPSASSAPGVVRASVEPLDAER